MNRNEVELRDYLRSLWTRKWLVLGLTLGAGVAAWGVNRILPAESIIEFSVRADMPAELGIQVKTFIENINQSSSNGSLPSILKMSPQGFPPVTATIESDPSRMRILVRSKDSEVSRTIVKAMVSYLNARFGDRWRKIHPEQEKSGFLRLLSEARNVRLFLGSDTMVIGFAAIFGFLFSTLLAYLLECLKEKRKTEAPPHG